MRVLAVTSVVPRDLTGGDKIYAHHLFEGLSKLADLTVIGHEDTGAVGNVARQYRAMESGRLRRNLRALSLLSGWPSSLFVNRSAALRKLIDCVVRDLDIDALICDHLRMSWAGEYFNARRVQLGKQALPSLLITQNVEAEVSRAAARHERNPLKAAALWIDALKVQRAERRAMRVFDAITAISEDDAGLIRTTYQRDSTVITPGYSSDTGFTAGSGLPRKRQAIVVGTFWSENKKENLLELIECAMEVFPKHGVRLKIVGSIPPELHRKLAGRHSFLDVLGAVEDLRPHLAESAIGIIAETRGGGFKLKALDYIFAGLPMAVVEGTVNGLPLVRHDEYLSYRNIPELVGGVVTELEVPQRLNRIGVAAYLRCKGKFSWQDRAQELLRVVESCVAAGAR